MYKWGSTKFNLSLLILFLVVLIDQAGILIISPIFPDLLTQLTHSSVESNVLWMGVLTASYAVMQFIFAPLIGKLSDQHGRKKILLLSMSAFVIDYIIMALATNVYVLFIGRIIAGISGSCITVAFASVADISTEKTRMKNFGILYAAIGAGLILGPLVGGVGAIWGLRVPFWLAAAFSLLNLILVATFFVETRQPKQKYEASVGWFLTSYRKLIRYPRVKGLVWSQFLVLLAFNSTAALWPYFLHLRFGWGSGYIGGSLAALGLGMVLVQLLLVPVIYRKVGGKNTVLLGLIFNIISSLAVAVVPYNWFLLSGIYIFYCLGCISSAAAGSILSGHIPEDQQGELQGVSASLNSIVLVMSPPVMSYILSYSVKHDLALREGNIFLLIGLLFLLTFILYAYTLRDFKPQLENN
ncbi:MAG: MFS transporter [Neisseriaceae bacterium]